MTTDPQTVTHQRSFSNRLSVLQPVRLVWLGLALALALLVVAPIAMLVIKSFTAAGSGGFTFDNYVAAYGRARHVQALWNTLIMGLCTTVLAVLLAVPTAWACTRTNMPGRTLVRIALFGAFLMPPYLTGVGWILLAGPNAGFINQAWTALTGLGDPLVNIFSFGGLVLVMGVSTFFTIFILVSAAFELLSSEMEDAANILGAGPFTTAFKITLPMAMPTILGSALLTFLVSIALYGVPALISIPARYPVVVIQLAEFFSFPIRIEVAAAYSIPLLGITIGLLLLQRRVLGRKGYTAVGGKGGERRIIDLGRWKWAVFAYAMLVVLLSVAMPLLVLLMAAFSHSWVDGFSIDNFTLEHFHYVLFEHSSSQKALLTSVGTGAAAATLAISLALSISYIVQRRLLPYGGVLAFLCMSPFVIPGIVLAIGFYAVYALPPVGLYGTYIILVLAFTTRFLPIAYTTSTNGVRAINPEMEEAVRILGGGQFTAIRKVVAPLLKRTLASGWILMFVPAAQELSTAVFLVGPHTRVVSVVLLDMSEEGTFERLAALGSVLLLIIAAIVLIGVKLLGRDFMLRRT
ncbi:ABC transporter permease [Pararhodobacter zhoushanensis]|uniref:Iron ABC transporter permease n=1 Tax=Pararhodobacter zhoushanensis TaxID=2479545 RepID=A0ABT3H558_9RHOB|nr:iron ABC transporter permease [Pararhodobacter zhoushanensis]MCW1934947.1 iron ABC transporter permease [Pararhodobacter zhoushanensis]